MSPPAPGVHTKSSLQSDSFPFVFFPVDQRLTGYDSLKESFVYLEPISEIPFQLRERVVEIFNNWQELTTVKATALSSQNGHWPQSLNSSQRPLVADSGSEKQRVSTGRGTYLRILTTGGSVLMCLCTEIPAVPLAISSVICPCGTDHPCAHDDPQLDTSQGPYLP